MKISIITPSLNQGKYIRACINSVLMQSYTNIQHIVIDGGSTDETLNILNEIRERDMRLQFVSESDAGQGEAVNKGLLLASGEIVAWINSDDFYYDNAVFERIFLYFKENVNVDIVYGRMIYVDCKNRINHIRLPQKYESDKLRYISYIGNTNAFYRQKVIKKHKLDISYHYVIDHEYMLRITRDFVAKSYDVDVACFRVHDEAKTKTLDNKLKNKERFRRDKAHAINRTPRFIILQFIFRIKYKISLIYADMLYLNKYRKNESFKNFLCNDEAN